MHQRDIPPTVPHDAVKAGCQPATIGQSGASLRRVSARSTTGSAAISVRTVVRVSTESARPVMRRRPCVRCPFFPQRTRGSNR